jgi:carbon-monoxide dehydrogenase small subunit
MSEPIRFSLTVNGSERSVTCSPRKTLADALREDCGLTGTHVGCEHGVCGTCTVVVDGRPVRSCLMFAVQAEGAEVRTVEGLSHDGGLSSLQQAFIDNHALQCGFCTPGFLMLISGAFERDPDISDDELTELLSSNLCRCTGYRNIVRAAVQAAPDLRTSANVGSSPVGGRMTL